MARSYQKFKASGQQFEIETKYNFLRPIGHGAYGVVISAIDKSQGEQKVAIKKITRVFDDPVDAKRILREIKLMKKFHHENVIRILDLCPPPSTLTDFDDIYIVQDLMETDLHRIIYSRQQLSLEHVQYFIYQILRGLKYIHSANVIHRDLKPSNILVNGNCDLKICDFGLARGLEDEQLGLTEYVVTRWYRAPEIMLACQDYTKAIDVWSVGCIFAELLARQALFPGSDYIAQLRLICEKLGRPSEKEMDFITSDRAKRFIHSLPDTPPVPAEEIFPEWKNERSAHDLFQKLMIFHPGHRATIDDALKHPFMSSLHNPEDEPTANFSFHFTFENETLSKERVQELIWDEIKQLHPDIPETFPSSTHNKKRMRSDSPDDSLGSNDDKPTHKRDRDDQDSDKDDKKELLSSEPLVSQSEADLTASQSKSNPT